NKKMTAAIHQLYKDIGDFNARIEDNVGGIRVVKAFTNEAFEKKQFARNNAQFKFTKLSSYKLIAKSSSITYMMMRFVTLFVLVCSTWVVNRGELTIGTFIGFLLLSNVLLRTIK